MEESRNGMQGSSYLLLFMILFMLIIMSLASPVMATNTVSGNKFKKNSSEKNIQKKLAYIVSDSRIPYWNIMGRGIKSSANKLGYDVKIYSAENSAKQELQFTVKAIRENVAGIIVSPTNSSACVTILRLAKKANIPVVIADIGTDSGEYVSYISSDNRLGAYNVGKLLANKMHQLGWNNGSVGIVAIPQKRLNGRLRTEGFMQAMDEAGIRGAGIKQQSTFSYQETYEFTQQLIENNSNLRAIFIQGSDRYKGAVDAIVMAGKKGQILLASFDAEPVFLELIPQEVIVGAAMQQPYLMGEEAVQAMHQHLNGKKVEKNKQLSVLAVSTDNIDKKLPRIKRNVLGIKEK